MEIEQSTLQRTFVIKHRGKNYYVNYLNSDGQILGLINRNNWEIFNENSEELQIYIFKGQSKKDVEKIKKNVKLFDKLVGYCIKHFNDYNPIKQINS